MFKAQEELTEDEKETVRRIEALAEEIERFASRCGEAHVSRFLVVVLMAAAYAVGRDAARTFPEGEELDAFVARAFELTDPITDAVRRVVGDETPPMVVAYAALASLSQVVNWNNILAEACDFKDAKELFTRGLQLPLHGRDGAASPPLFGV